MGFNSGFKGLNTYIIETHTVLVHLTCIS